MKLVRSSDSGTVPGLASVGEAINRRTFLKRSGVALGAGAAASMFVPQLMKKAQAAAGFSPMAGVQTEIRRSVCTHCSVGCGVVAEVQNGVWTGQEPDFDSPFNLGSHCSKGATVREHGMGEKTLALSDETGQRKMEKIELGYSN